jgi:hypothetical protein
MSSFAVRRCGFGALALGCLGLLGFLGCASSAPPALQPPAADSGPADTGLPGVPDANSPLLDGASDAQTDAPVSASKAARCATDFGGELAAPFGRMDGTVLAMVKPTDQQCTQPNRNHTIIQILSGGKVYRMVVAVVSTRAGVAPDVRFASVQRPLPAPAWADGWHVNAPLDYVSTLNVHNADFVATPKDQLVQLIDDAIALDSKISVYATTQGGPSAHLVHRNKENADGAVVLNPDSAKPTFLLFHFDQQAF